MLIDKFNACYFQCGLITIRYYGGWAAPNIYFLGFSGVVKFGNIRIAGLSGIHKHWDYHLGKFVIYMGYFGDLLFLTFASGSYHERTEAYQKMAQQ